MTAQAIEGKSVRVQTMSDGTLRLTVDISPRLAKDAFILFGEPGIDVALAKLNLSQYQDITEDPPQDHEPKKNDHKLSRLAAMFCNNEKFWEFLNESSQEQVHLNNDDAKAFLYNYCSIESRAELDDPLKPDAILKFHEIRKAFSSWGEGH